MIILQHAARAIELGEALTGEGIEKRFLGLLANAKSNLPEMGKGDQVYERFVKPRRVTLDRVVNHHAISSLFDKEEKERKIFSYRVEEVNVEKLEKGERWMVLGEVKVIPEIIPEPEEFFFGLIPSEQDVFRTWVLDGGKAIDFDALRAKGVDSLGRGEDEMAKALASLPGNRVLTLRDTFKEDRQAIFEKLIEREIEEHLRCYAEVFEKTKRKVEISMREGLEIPFEIRVAAEVTLSRRLLSEINALKGDFKGTLQRGEVERIVKEAEQFGLHLRREAPVRILNDMLKEKMRQIQKGLHPDPLGQSGSIEEMITFLRSAEKWGFELSKEEAQDVMDEILKKYVRTLEESWWEDGRPQKTFPPQLLLLAEKLGFNVERFSKMIPTAIPIGRWS
jgi:hypothetical protein